MNTSADFKLIDKAKRNADRIAAHLNVPTLWVSVMYADGGFVYVRTMTIIGNTESRCAERKCHDLSQ